MVKNQDRILIVDDEVNIREYLYRALSQNGYYCEEAENGQDALDRLTHDSYDLAILDIRMPGKSGIDTLKEIKNKYLEMAVVMATASTELNTAMQCMKL